MKNNNPIIIPRNQIVEQVIEEAVNGNKTMFNNRCYVISAKEFSKAATIVLLFYSFLTFAVYTFS